MNVLCTPRDCLLKLSISNILKREYFIDSRVGIVRFDIFKGNQSN